MTLDYDSNQFYRGIRQAGDGSKILIFVSERILYIAKNYCSLRIQSDATFKSLPILQDGYQLFFISLELDRNIYPIITAIMESKSTKAYECVFRLLKQYLQNITILSSMTDYEYAVINAVKKVYPDCEVKGCFFHFAKAITDNAYKKGVYALADDTNTILCAISYAKALALLPEEMFPAGIAIVEEKLTNAPECVNFINYLRRQWINKAEVIYFIC